MEGHATQNYIRAKLFSEAKACTNMIFGPGQSVTQV